MTKAEEKEIRKKRLKLRFFYILIGLTVAMAGILAWQIVSITVLK